MAHEVETMAYQAAEKPWHGLGNPVNGRMSVDEMLQAAGLDWDNESEKLFVYRPDQVSQLNASPFVSLDSLNKDNTKYRAITRQSDGYVHNIMTSDYNIVQNRQVMAFLREYVESAGMTLETAGALKHGSLIWVLAKIESSFTLPGNDLSQTYVLLSNAHDGTQELAGQFTSIRVVCANTIKMAQNAKRGRSFSFRHSAKLTESLIQAAKAHMGLAIEATEQLAEVATKMAATSVSQFDRLNYVARLTKPALLESGIDETKNLDVADFSRSGKDILLAIENGIGQNIESARDTVWGLLNGVTMYVDHQAGHGRDTALTSAWFGSGAKLKELAYVEAVKLVNR